MGNYLFPRALDWVCISLLRTPGLGACAGDYCGLHPAIMTGGHECFTCF